MNYKEENNLYYNNTKKAYGEGNPKVLWQNEKLQVMRFSKQASLFDYNNKSILDVGCGYGDFYFYLLEKGMLPQSYTGIDLIQSHCDFARNRLPEEAFIINGDFLEISLPEVDIAVLSGAFNVYFNGWLSVVSSIIDKMWLLSKEAITFNIRSPHSLQGDYPKKSQQIKELDPSYWCKYAHNKTSKYALYHDYMPNDYTIVMWKEQEIII